MCKIFFFTVLSPMSQTRICHTSMKLPFEISVQTLERIQRGNAKFMFGYESPVTYPDR